MTGLPSTSERTPVAAAFFRAAGAGYWSSLVYGEQTAFLSKEGSGIAKRDPTSQKGGWFLIEPCKDAALEPPPARSRLRRDRAALLTKEGSFGTSLRTELPLPDTMFWHTRLNVVECSVYYSRPK
jgi:hypothetical protein